MMTAHRATSKRLENNTAQLFECLFAGLVVVAALLPRSAAANDEVLLTVYTGYGTPSEVFLSGRVLEDEGLARPDPRRSSLKNLADAARRLESDELPGVEVVVTIGPHSWVRRTDDDGLWSVHATGPRPRLAPGTRSVQVFLNNKSAEPKGKGEAIILDPGAAVAVVSDFDDTVVHTYVRDKKRMVREALFRNAAQLVPVSGAGEAFRAAKRAGAAAFFYLSGSPQNYYERINDFLRLQELPSGPLLLKNFGSDPLFDQRGYKSRRIQQLMDRLPMLKFILIGDSGEADPEIYAETRANNPNRIVGIVIRRVDGDESPESRFKGMSTAPDFTNATDLIAGWVRSAAGTAAAKASASP